jgi:membrane protease YdiL (CAAX protease family)
MRGFGLLLAFFGCPLLLLIARRLRLDSLSPAVRLGLWLICFGVVGIAAQTSDSWMRQLGISAPTPKTVLAAVAGVAITLAAWPLIKLVQLFAGGLPVEQTAQFQRLVQLSIARRLFIIATAGVVEETLYRGYGIGLGKYIFGSAWTAALVSLVIFTCAHFRWGLSHLLSVFWAGFVLTLLFVFNQDLIACILAHIAIDVIGILIAPAIIARRNAMKAG